jgi:hypothetical protein
MLACAHGGMGEDEKTILLKYLIASYALGSRHGGVPASPHAAVLAFGHGGIHE